MMFTKTFFVSLLACVASANPAPQNTVDVNAITSAVGKLPLASQAALLSSLSAYQKSLAADPMFTSALGVIATAVPASDLQKAAADPSGYIQSALTATSTPGWYKSLPSSYQSYFQSIGSAQLSIVQAATMTGGSAGSATAKASSIASSAGARATSAGASATSAAGSATSAAGGSATASPASQPSNGAEKMGKGVKIAAAGFGGLVAGLLAL